MEKIQNRNLIYEFQSREWYSKIQQSSNQIIFSWKIFFLVNILKSNERKKKLSATQSLLSASVRPLKNWARAWAALKVLMSKLKPCFWIVFLFIYFVYCTRCACVKTFKFHHVRLPLTRLGQSIAKTAWMSVRWLLLSSSL